MPGSGKHVLCEKPFALDSDRIPPVLEYANERNLVVGEAFMVRTHPQWIKTRELIDSGFIGELKCIHGFFSYYNDDPNNIRNNKEYGGGALWDIGCYPVNLSRFILGEEPESVHASIDEDPRFETDRRISALLNFGVVSCTFTASTQLVPYQKMQFFGTTGMLELEIPFNAPPDEPCIIYLHKGDKKGPAEEIHVAPANQYATQADAFSQAVFDGKILETSLQDSWQNTRVIEALFRSAASGKSETPGNIGAT